MSGFLDSKSGSCSAKTAFVRGGGELVTRCWECMHWEVSCRDEFIGSHSSPVFSNYEWVKVREGRDASHTGVAFKHLYVLSGVRCLNKNNFGHAGMFEGVTTFPEHAAQTDFGADLVPVLPTVSMAHHRIRACGMRASHVRPTSSFGSVPLLCSLSRQDALRLGHPARLRFLRLALPTGGRGRLRSYPRRNRGSPRSILLRHATTSLVSDTGMGGLQRQRFTWKKTR